MKKLRITLTVFLILLILAAIVVFPKAVSYFQDQRLFGHIQIESFYEPEETTTNLSTEEKLELIVAADNNARNILQVDQSNSNKALATENLSLNLKTALKDMKDHGLLTNLDLDEDITYSFIRLKTLTDIDQPGLSCQFWVIVFSLGNSNCTLWMDAENLKIYSIFVEEISTNGIQLEELSDLFASYLNIQWSEKSNFKYMKPEIYDSSTITAAYSYSYPYSYDIQIAGHPDIFYKFFVENSSFGILLSTDLLNDTTSIQ